MTLFRQNYRIRLAADSFPALKTTDLKKYTYLKQEVIISSAFDTVSRSIIGVEPAEGNISEEYVHVFGPLGGQLEIPESVRQESRFFCKVSNAFLFLGREILAKLPPVLGQGLVQLRLSLLQTL